MGKINFPTNKRVLQVHDARVHIFAEFVHGRRLDSEPTWFMVTGENLNSGYLNSSMTCMVDEFMLIYILF